MTNSLASYPKVFNLGHRALADLLLDPVLVEEKVDGSQFSFGRFDGELRVRSKEAFIEPTAPPKMFAEAVEFVSNLPLQDGWTYRAEWLAKPKHNTLAYDRRPLNGLILFDISPGLEEYVPWTIKATEAARLGIDVVPVLFMGMVTGPDMLLGLLDTVSCLGGPTVEGVVVKNYQRFGIDKHVLMGKYVSEKFKEQHKATWKRGNPTGKDIQTMLGDMLTTEARWHKAVQHLRDRGELQDAPQDIGPLMKEVALDSKADCEELVKQKLWEWAWPDLHRQVTRGLPEWYKKQLLEKQFAENDQAPGL